MPKCVLGKVKRDNAGQLWPLASLQVQVSCCLNNHFLHFFIYCSFSLTFSGKSMVGKYFTGFFDVTLHFCQWLLVSVGMPCMPSSTSRDLFLPHVVDKF